MTFDEATRQFQRDYWRQLLNESGGDVRKAALAAGVNRTHAYEWLHRLGIERISRRRRGNWEVHGL